MMLLCRVHSIIEIARSLSKAATTLQGSEYGCDLRGVVGCVRCSGSRPSVFPSSPNPECSASPGVRCHQHNKPQALTPSTSHTPHHVRTNAPTSPRRSAQRLGTNHTHLHILQLARRRDALPQRTHPHTPTHRTPTRIDNRSAARIALSHIANPHADTIFPALALPVPSAPLRSPQPLAPRGAAPMDPLLDPDLAEQRAHIYFISEDILAGR